MEANPGPQPSGPSGALVERVGDQVAAANQLIQDSRKLIVHATVQIQQTHGRVGRNDQRGHDSAGRARAAHEPAIAAGQRFQAAKQRELAAHDRAISRLPSCRSAWVVPTGRPLPAPMPSTRGSYANRPYKSCATGKRRPQPTRITQRRARALAPPPAADEGAAGLEQVWAAVTYQVGDGCTGPSSRPPNHQRRLGHHSHRPGEPDHAAGRLPTRPAQDMGRAFRPPYSRTRRARRSSPWDHLSGWAFLTQDRAATSYPWHRGYPQVTRRRF